MTGTATPPQPAAPAAGPATLHDRVQAIAACLPDKEFWFRLRHTLEQTGAALAAFTAVYRQVVDNELASLAQSRTVREEQAAAEKLLREVEYRQWLEQHEERAR